MGTTKIAGAPVQEGLVVEGTTFTATDGVVDGSSLGQFRVFGI